MKKLLLTLIACAIVTIASAQTKTIKYFSKSGFKEVPESEAHYLEATEENADGGGTRTRFLIKDKVKVSLYTYSDIDGGKYKSGIKDGPHYQWHENGKLKTEAAFRNDTLAGEYKTWYESGKLLYTRKYNRGQAPDTLMAYYETGKLRRIEVYEQNKLITGKLYNEDGREIKFYPMFKLPEFPGGEQMMMNWLYRNIQYPKEAIAADAQGTVFISFIVDKTGGIRDAEVIKGVHAAADAEALRVVNRMPAWQPGRDEGKAVAVRFTLPVTFRLQD